MYVQMTCPNCRTPYTAEVHQIVDSDETPELKRRLLANQLNIAVCPGCGAGGQMATPLVFHDAAHEMFLIYMPQELNMGQMEREQTIGQLTQQVMNKMPAEKRRAYMLQPQVIISMQTFMEKVLETEGITKEMIERQKKQLELLQTLAKADKDVIDHLVRERGREIDETFFAMLQQYIDGAAQANDNSQLIPLTNLRAHLMTTTEVGRQLEKRQIAVHAFNREAKAKNELSPALLLKHLLKNQGDEGIENALVMAGQPALTYQFFQLLTEEIEKREKAKDQATVERLTAMRERLLKIFDAMQAQSKKMLDQAEKTLQAIMAADDKEAAVQGHGADIDDAFMYLLATRIAQADQQGQKAEAQALNDLHELIIKRVESQYPPEILLLTQLMDAPGTAEQGQILDENQALITPNLIKMVDALTNEFERAGQEEANGRLQAIKTMIEARLL